MQCQFNENNYSIMGLMYINTLLEELGILTNEQIFSRIIACSWWDDIIGLK